MTTGLSTACPHWPMPWKKLVVTMPTSSITAGGRGLFEQRSPARRQLVTPRVTVSHPELVVPCRPFRERGESGRVRYGPSPRPPRSPSRSADAPRASAREPAASRARPLPQSPSPWHPGEATSAVAALQVLWRRRRPAGRLDPSAPRCAGAAVAGAGSPPGEDALPPRMPRTAPATSPGRSRDGRSRNGCCACERVMDPPHRCIHQECEPRRPQ